MIIGKYVLTVNSVRYREYLLIKFIIQYTIQSLKLYAFSLKPYALSLKYEIHTFYNLHHFDMQSCIQPG